MTFASFKAARSHATAALALGILLLAVLPSSLAVAADKSSVPAAPTWDRQAAARYLDNREVWWQGWDHARRDHGTMCVSCHTQAPYALARPVLRPDLGESAASPAETAMLADVEKRVRGWNDMLPFYDDKTYGTGKEIESRNAESVLNAVILTSYDMPRGHLSDLTLSAFDHAWALQSKSGPDAGAWVWQNFDYAPWESKESQYHWAALLAMTIGQAPDGYRDNPKIAANLALLSSYLRSHYAAQPLVNKVATLWASASMPGLITDAQRNELLAQLVQKQHPDGGWSLTDLGTWERRDNTPLETSSDGYATGLIVLAFEEARTGPIPAHRGIDWLLAHQDRTTGAWPAWSLNKNRDPKSQVGQFMSDAATGYAILALEKRR